MKRRDIFVIGAKVVFSTDHRENVVAVHPPEAINGLDSSGLFEILGSLALRPLGSTSDRTLAKTAEDTAYSLMEKNEGRQIRSVIINSTISIEALEKQILDKLS